MGARYYDPVIGRFVSTDSKGFDEGNIHSFNRYAYANNNPYRYIDPNGMEGISTLWMPNNAPLVVAGKAFGSLAAYGTALANSDAALKNAALEGMRESREVNIEVGLLLATMGRGKGSAEAEEGILYRAGGSNPGSFKMRSGEDAVSFRDSLSNPADAAAKPVFKPGDQFVGVDSSKLPAGSVVRDGSPPGHVSVTAAPDQIRNAIVERGRFPQ
jgi:uncharacterized protein RhaS with RHS repeats